MVLCGCVVLRTFVAVGGCLVVFGASQPQLGEVFFGCFVLRTFAAVAVVQLFLFSDFIYKNE